MKGAYRHTVEITVFCHPDHTGKGVGSRLLGSLLDSLRQKGRSSPKAGASRRDDRGGEFNEGSNDAEVKQVLAVMAVDETGMDKGLKLKEFYEGFGFQMVCDETYHERCPRTLGTDNASFQVPC